MRLKCAAELLESASSGNRHVAVHWEEEQALHIQSAGDAATSTHLLLSILGEPFLVHRPDLDTVVSAELAARGYWESAESQVLLALVRPGMVVLDAGANIGYYTLLLSRAIGPSGWVHAFEPEPVNYRTLLANVLLARRRQRERASIRVWRLALADRVGAADLSVFARNLGMHSLHVTSSSARRVQVTTTTVDALRWDAPAPEAGITSRVDLIKADIQGGEPRLLRGAERTLLADRPILCLEIEPYLSGPDACCQMLAWLAQRGYTRFRVFHANECRPQHTLRELARVLSAAGAMDEVRRGRIGAYGTLLAVHDEPSWPSAPAEC